MATNGILNGSSDAITESPEKISYTEKESLGDVSHQVISSHFIGPQAENLPYFKKNIDTILEELRLARTSYFPKDGVRYRTRAS